MRTASRRRRWKNISMSADEDKRKYKRLKAELFKTKSKVFCMKYAPVIVAILEVIIEGYYSYKKRTRN